MEDMISTFQIIFTTIGGYIGWVVGGIDGFIYALIMFVVIDYITGVMVSVLDKRVSSDIGFRGIFRKVLIFAMIAIGNVIDDYLIKDGNTIRTAIVFFYISNEGISILENSSKIGLPIPEKLKAILKEINKDN
ncbi:toxin secretion/phage lysis holin [Gottschalkia acidurici 9a]|uniref:Toxin secretion/phage lysis holin n=1 Tax=Gottschalkia acidurici (strain ATCC 7906 / DSM 604 / BCRC 14475 / CIP 104303 / KCTC 5404 / NCIMB 10678 / 9a) TaxID=1128398 RepID=K0AXZ1_GOTA9|nr:phage holin family protein [Gottschalkia acidurici]AFS77647.1 toxin secretion/phage lysis holin [Gottschalkia acidurici 9a]